MRSQSIAMCVLAVVLGWEMPASAQLWTELKKQSPEQAAGDQTDFWVRTLALDSEQAAAFHQVNLRYATDMRLTVRAPGDDGSKVDSMRALEDQKTQEILEILDTEQRARYVAFTQRERRLLRREVSAPKASE